MSKEVNWIWLHLSLSFSRKKDNTSRVFIGILVIKSRGPGGPLPPVISAPRTAHSACHRARWKFSKRPLRTPQPYARLRRFAELAGRPSKTPRGSGRAVLDEVAWRPAAEPTERPSKTLPESPVARSSMSPGAGWRSPQALGSGRPRGA
jgi:hypothetical protein